MADQLAADVSGDDRRRVVNGGSKSGRAAEIADKRVLADLEVTDVTSSAVATRGDRLALTRVRSSVFQTESLNIVEVDDDERIVAMVAFDPDDIDAAFEELDSRYAAGEAAAQSRTWSVIAAAFAGLNRHEIPSTSTEFINIDLRRGTSFDPGDLFAYLRAAWDLTPDRRHCVEAIHQLTGLGAVLSATAYGTTTEGFNVEWRMTVVYLVERGLTSRIEIFDEGDLDAALARFDELSRQAPP